MSDDFFDLPEPQGQRLVMNPGSGNLQEQALRAAIIGPARVAHGNKRPVVLQPGEPARISNVSTVARHCVYVALFLPLSSEGTLEITVGQEDMQGDNSSIPVRLEPRLGPSAGISFGCVLLPGETLYAQSSQDEDVSLVISEVYF